MSRPRRVYQHGVGREFPGVQSDTPGGYVKYPLGVWADRHPIPLALDTLGVFDSNTPMCKSITPHSNANNSASMFGQPYPYTSLYGVRIYMQRVSICSNMYSVYYTFFGVLFLINYVSSSILRFFVYDCVNGDLIWIVHHDATAIHGAA